MNEKLKIAKDLLKIQAVFLRPDEPFTWASGIKSPIYCDNRLTLSDHQVRLEVENGHHRPPAGTPHGLRPFRGERPWPEEPD